MKTPFESMSELKKFNFKTATEKEIENILPTFGMNNEGLEELPKELHHYTGYGIKFWQYPIQLSKLICFIREKEINSYLEIGVRWGGTFIIINEVLRKNNPHVRSFANDFIDPSDILNSYQHDFEGNPFSYIQMGSDNPFLRYSFGSDNVKPTAQIDMVFIDGNHMYWAIMEDYHRALSLVAKYIVFHDIVSNSSWASEMAWKTIKKKHKKIHEFTDQYDSVAGKYMGIGILEITKEDEVFPFFKEYYLDLFGE